MKKNKKFCLLFVFLFLFSVFSYCGDYDEIASDLVKNLNPNNNLAIVSFDYKTDNPKSRTPFVISERLTTAILKNKEIQNKKIKLIERNLIEKVLEEQKLSQTGIIDIEIAKKIGKILAADLIITGSIYDISYDEVEVNIRTIDVEKGIILSSSNKKLKKNWIDTIPEKLEQTGNKTDAYLYCDMAIKEVDKENFKKAIWFFTQAIKEDITGGCGINWKGFAYFARGASYIFNGNYDKSIEDLNFYIEMNYKDKEAYFYSQSYFYRGFAYYYLKQYDKAINDYDKAIELDPTGECGTGTKGSAYYNRGLVYYYLNQYDKAISDYNKAIELNPNLALTYLNRGVVYIIINQYDKAINDFNKAIELNPNLAEAYCNRGNVYGNLKQYNKAINDFNKAVKLNPENAIAYYNRGLVYLYLKQYDKAIKDYDKAIELDPTGECGTGTKGVVYYNLGSVYQILKQYNKAISDYTKAIELNPNLVDAYYNRGIAYKKLGLEDKAQKDFEMYRKLTGE